ncbi:unnamed protein product [Arabis nemorensis]|uniref:Uncharacterized protein n=1 Tax=Arabis nemorensis TaxID=586526 RepID=A0A565C4N8_9BRAS|nr:unnamed protein product [Arabis nemorensis]
MSSKAKTTHKSSLPWSPVFARKHSPCSQLKSNFTQEMAEEIERSYETPAEGTCVNTEFIMPQNNKPYCDPPRFGIVRFHAFAARLCGTPSGFAFADHLPRSPSSHAFVDRLRRSSSWIAFVDHLCGTPLGLAFVDHLCGTSLGLAFADRLPGSSSRLGRRH